jgi:hypothetical protein
MAKKKPFIPNDMPSTLLQKYEYNPKGFEKVDRQKKKKVKPKLHISHILETSLMNYSGTS